MTFNSAITGSAVVLAYLKEGYRVRGTVRSQDKAKQWLEFYPEHKDTVEFTIVPDITKDGAFDEAVKGVSIIAHVASPLSSKFGDVHFQFLPI